ncbi:DUF6272 family protein [sulfur-oxidizing endosymbiont of Gigantopelta aegis]|uniref:DUF6272 family protein n=1 Tax=sulfur-oxidizing endosymbiont of Gigantopelta aegis TaxID=2794934 RepID=UPI0018DB558C|nr:DUF6272 family protein [sulfur-oxidizing endosymbiont of Gigantopelta aegis]
MIEIDETIGCFSDIENKLSTGENLQLGFLANSIPLKERWRNNGLSADFMGDYATTFFPKNENNPETIARQAEIKSAVSYVANELLENAMKYSDKGDNCLISISLIFEDNQIILTESNSVAISSVQNYKSFVHKLSQSDPMEMYLEQLEAKALDDNMTSGLGFLSMINDYSAELAWQFKSSKTQDVISVTTEVRLPI